MRLSREDGSLFYKLYPALMFYTNQRLSVINDFASGLDGYLAVPYELRLKVRDALYAHRELIDEFIRENPASLTPDELGIVFGWNNAVVGTFCILRYLKHCTVFLHDASPPKAYDVIALDDPLERLLGSHLPVFTRAVLLPFKGKIIYDGLLLPLGIFLGPGVLKSVNESYREAKAKFGVMSSLPLMAQGTFACPPVVPPPKGKFTAVEGEKGMKKVEARKKP